MICHISLSFSCVIALLANLTVFRINVIVVFFVWWNKIFILYISFLKNCYQQCYYCKKWFCCSSFVWFCIFINYNESVLTIVVKTFDRPLRSYHRCYHGIKSVPLWISIFFKISKFYRAKKQKLKTGKKGIIESFKQRHLFSFETRFDIS